MKFLVPLSSNDGLNSIVSSHFGRAPYYGVVIVTLDGRFEFKIKSASTVHGESCGATDLVEKFDVDAVVVKGIGPRAIAALQSTGVKIYSTNGRTLKDVIDEALNGKLKPLTSSVGVELMRESRGYGRRRMLYAYPPPPPMYPPPMYPSPMQPPAYQLAPRQLRAGRIKVAVACEGRGGLDDLVSMRFGRAPTFTILEVEAGQIKNVSVEYNPYVNQPHGVGIAISQYFASKGVNVAVAGRFGPNAMQVLQSLGIRVVQVPPGIRVRDVLRYL